MKIYFDLEELNILEDDGNEEYNIYEFNFKSFVKAYIDTELEIIIFINDNEAKEIYYIEKNYNSSYYFNDKAEVILC